MTKVTELPAPPPETDLLPLAVALTKDILKAGGWL